MSQFPVIDGHNDVLLRLWQKKSESAHHDFITGDGLGHIDFPRLQAGQMVGGFFAIFPPPQAHLPGDDDDLNPPPEGQLSQRLAWKSAQEMMSLLKAMAEHSEARFVLAQSMSDIVTAMREKCVFAICHMEGAEAIAPDLSNLQDFHDQGLRSLGLVWSRPNAFGHGVPFRFPSSGDTGPGLTDAGRALVKACNELRIMIDLSHLNEKGFWDVAKLSAAPLVATHSNAHALSASSRNLTDQQLRAVGESGGLVGLNFATGFLRADGRWSSDTPPETLILHLQHMIDMAGEDCVGLGSDFDGARIPGFIRDAAGLPKLVEAMERAGFGDALIGKITHKNWMRVIARTWERA